METKNKPLSAENIEKRLLPSETCKNCGKKLTLEDYDTQPLGECHPCYYKPTDLPADLYGKNNCSASDEVYFKNLHKTRFF